MPKEKLIIIGAGGLGRIVYDVLLNNLAMQPEVEVHGFLDTRTDVLLPPGLTSAVLGNPLNYQPQAGEVFIPAVGDPRWRQDLVTPLVDKGARFFSHTRQASIGARTTIGRGTFLTPGAVVSTDCTIGEFNYLDTYVVIGHDVELGPHCMVGAMSFLAGGVRIGCGVAIHPRVTIAKGVRVGDGAVIGIGAVVVKDVPANVTVFGNPARTIYS
ncbi:MAG: acetyltransferase [Alcaligenaceae bacterium]|nr:MAG: acetyltransferase [Alcaligenaceae bacterium]